jgi:predicted ATPase
MNVDKGLRDSQQGGMAIQALDRDLLAKPFEVQTRWHVLTGAICSGKTTLLELLAAEGYRTLPEVSRAYIEQEVAKGRKIEEIFASQADERALTELQCQAELGLQPDEVIFLDRALPDYLWFWRLLGLDPNELLAHCLRHRYASVLILDQLPLQLDGARIDNKAYTDLFDEWLARDYGALGYDAIRVPVRSPQDRLAFVLDTLAARGLL